MCRGAIVRSVLDVVLASLPRLRLWRKHVTRRQLLLITVVAAFTVGGVSLLLAS